MAVKKQGGGFKGINDQALQRTYFEPGEYVVEVMQLTHGETPGSGTEFFGGDYVVLTSTNDSVKLGDVRSTFFSPNKFRTYFLRDIKGLLNAIVPDAEGYESFEDLAAKAIDESQPLRGKKLVIEATEAAESNPKTGKPYVRLKFRSLEEAGIDESELPNTADAAA